MTETWALAALWLGLALAATLLSIWLRVATAHGTLAVDEGLKLVYSISGAELGVPARG